MKEDVLSRKLVEELKLHGVSRRDFLKYCAATAAVLGLSELEFTTKVAHAMEAASKKPPVVWFAGQACTGCTISFAQILYPPASSIILDKISLRYHMTVMAAAGEVAEKALQEAIKEGGYVYIFEGAIDPSKDNPSKPGVGKNFKAEVGKLIGLAFHFNDCENGTREHQIGWTPGGAWDANAYGDLIFDATKASVNIHGKLVTTWANLRR